MNILFRAILPRICLPTVSLITQPSTFRACCGSMNRWVAQSRKLVRGKPRTPERLRLVRSGQQDSAENTLRPLQSLVVKVCYSVYTLINCRAPIREELIGRYQSSF